MHNRIISVDSISFLGGFFAVAHTFGLSKQCAGWRKHYLPHPPCSRLLSLAGLALAMCGCCVPQYNYRGDGHFNRTCSRYVLDFGELDLSSSVRRVFNVGVLPGAGRWIIGLDVSPIPERPATANLRDVVIKIEMATIDERLVLRETKPLGLWAWQMSAEGSEGIGPAFVYSAGRSSAHANEVTSGSEGATNTRGTMFRPISDVAYQLVVHVTRPTPEAKYFVVRLKAIGSSEIGSL